jgi:hypothetical protein
MEPRILHIITDLDCGGAEKMLVRLCTGTPSDSVAVLSLRIPG